MPNKDNNYLAKISELTDYLSTNNPDLDNLCEFVKTRVFAHLNPSGMFISKLNENGFVVPLAHCGFNENIVSSWLNYSINDELPPTDAIKNNSLIWIADNEEWHRNYPILAQFPSDEVTKTFITWPISARNSSMCVLGIILHETRRPSPDEVSFLEAVGSLVALQISLSSFITNKVADEDVIKLLTRRQREILHGMSDGLTNSQIANELGFSESTIRQESMRMYEILQVAGRKEAVQKYNKSSYRQSA
jgi:DNA-binding CsgD family transcriptional regulator